MEYYSPFPQICLYWLIITVLHTIDDIEIRGAAIMDMSPMDESERGQWRGFFSAAMDSKSRIWIAIATVRFLISNTHWC
jgi:hypothetical protein